jgi:ABC-type nitrate/sulfonate/bicarbonate transport system permease component
MIHSKLKEVGFYIGSLVLTIAAWHLLSHYFLNPRLVPPPASVAVSAWEMLVSLELFEHIGQSLKRIMVGYALGSTLGILGGVLMGCIPWIGKLVDPPLTLIRQVPPVAIIPLAIVWFGIGETSKYVVIFYGVLIVVLINTVAGVRSTPEIRVRAARCLGAGSVRTLMTIVLPSAMPYILTAMRLGLGFSFGAVVAAELIAADTGIGYLIMQSRFQIQIDRMFVGLLSLAVLGAVTDQLYQLLVRLTMKRFTMTQKS